MKHWIKKKKLWDKFSIRLKQLVLTSHPVHSAQKINMNVGRKSNCVYAAKTSKNKTSRGTGRRDRQRSGPTHRLEEEQRPDIVPLGVDDLIENAEPEPLLPIRVFGVQDRGPRGPVVLLHAAARTSRRACFRLSPVKRRASSSASIRTSTHDPASSVHRPEHGDKDHADVRGCAHAPHAPHAGNEVLLPLLARKK